MCSHGNVFNDETKMCYHAATPNTTTTHGRANAVCARNNGELVAIETAEISEFLDKALALDKRYSDCKRDF